jgi:hypothetical protein
MHRTNTRTVLGEPCQYSNETMSTTHPHCRLLWANSIRQDINTSATVGGSRKPCRTVQPRIYLLAHGILLRYRADIVSTTGTHCQSITRVYTQLLDLRTCSLTLLRCYHTETDTQVHNRVKSLTCSDVAVCTALGSVLQPTAQLLSS